jgi:hypothetical protein
MRPLAQLGELGYVRRDLPFGEHPRQTRRVLYRLNDAFLRFYFRFVLPFESTLSQGLTDEVGRAWQEGRSHYYASCWENLCRLAVPRMPHADIQWGVASAWWSGQMAQPEIDLVASSQDGQAILLGECKWSERKQVFDTDAMDRRLREHAACIPGAKGRRIVTSCWLGGAAEAKGRKEMVLTARDVMTALAY